MPHLNFVCARHHGTWLELHFWRDANETPDVFFNKVSEAATEMHGKAYWNGASDQAAIIFIKEIKT